jgi:hypothetical protein
VKGYYKYRFKVHILSRYEWYAFKWI